MTRLLYFVNIPRFFVTHRLPLALAAQQAGYDVHVATSAYDEANIAHIEAAGLPFHPLPLRQHSTAPHYEWEAGRAVYDLYSRLKPDIVHQVSIKAILYGGLAARLSHVPAVVNAVSGLGYVFIAQGPKVALIRTGSKQVYRVVLAHPNSRTIFQNPDDRDFFIHNGLIDPQRTVLIKGSGVDMDVFYPQPEPDGLPVVLFAGRLLWQKGVGEFVEVAQRLKGKARFVIVGFGEAGNPASVPPEKLAAWHDSGVIEAWGYRSDMPAVYAQSQIVCLPSSYGEGIPKALIEAAACGRAIVTTDSPGCREIVRHGQNGLLVPVHDTDALTRALQALIDDPARRQTMGAAGRRMAEAEFSLPQVNAQTLAVYEALLASKTRHNPQ
ncbi:MAG: glycosyltransferase family 1 protein [Anaerolineaceae bacterium]|nr:glycosyltransferase family 1 protein [Anaerolineaceae bacterium]